MEEQVQVVKISVRNLVEFLLRSGDLDNRISSGAQKEAMQEGGRIHRKIQKSMGASYRAEVPLKIEVSKEDFVLCIEGRADGIDEKGGQVLVDEIKGIYRPLEFVLEPVPVHRAQAMCYAHIYCTQHPVEAVTVQLTYCNIETEEIKRFQELYTKEALQSWFDQLTKEYEKWAVYTITSRKLRNESARKIVFPFAYRKGQKDLAASVYRTIRLQKKLFVQAPTGVGKTISTIFPAVKAVGEGLGEKIFYLTAKTITRTVAYEAFALLKKQGLSMSVIILTAKDKMCICEEVACNPDCCERAKGHYDRINEAVYGLITKEQSINREILLEYAQRYQVCPFEFGLDVSLFVDAVICDYNYVFDPRVHLKRFFGENVMGEYLFLVDEAHNLVDRAREMYSANVYKESLTEAKRLIGDQDRKLARILDKCSRGMQALKKECCQYQVLSSAGGLPLDFLKLQSEMDRFLEENREFEEREGLLELYFDLNHFLNMHELLDESYEIYTEIQEDGRFLLKLFCINPSHNLSQYMNKGNSTIFFSATLLPMAYYKEMLGDLKEDYAIYVESPFAVEHRLLAVCSDISSKYTRRGYEEYEKVFYYLNQVLDGKEGNYMIFFPSYRMMEEVYSIVTERGLHLRADFLVQESGMSEQKREAFLEAFEQERKKSLVAFCVMGGIFAEGIDLTEEKLLGALIMGTGLPMVCNEREILKFHYDEQQRNGFSYAYLYPGMNKVLQAAGRVIRTDNDQGVILLMDERFLQRQYQSLFPVEWQNYEVMNLRNARDRIDRFWTNINENKGELK